MWKKTGGDRGRGTIKGRMLAKPQPGKVFSGSAHTCGM